MNATNVVRFPKNRNILTNDTPVLVTCIKFDDSHSLLWVGDSRGYLTSYTGSSLSMYTSVKAHNEPILKIINHKKGVLSLSFGSIRLGTSEGVTLFNIHSEELKGLNTMSYTSNTQTELLVAGDKDATGSRIFKVDTVNHCISGSFHYPHTVVMMVTNLKYIILGRSDGFIDIMDPKTNNILKTFKGHSSGISDISVKDNNLLTSGFSVKKEQFIPDTFVNSFDLKSLTTLPPIPFPAGAAKVFHHPTMPNVILISSSAGHMNFLDVKNPTRLNIYQAEISTYITAFDIATSGSFLAFVDGSHKLSLWSSKSNEPNSGFALFNSPLTYPTPVSEVIPAENHIVSPESPLSLVKVPPFHTPLLSAFPSDLVFKVGALPRQIDPEIQRSSEVVNGVVVARYNREKFGPRNLANKYTSISSLTKNGTVIPRFLSEKDDDSEIDDYEHAQNKIKEEAIANEIFSLKSTNNDVPNAYKQLSILYSKFGVDDFDFDIYNKTKYSGLEINSGNSFLNPILQLYRFIAPIFNHALLSLSEDVTMEPNLLVELGYLYDMMNKSNGKHCAASNFQIIFSQLEKAKQLGLTKDTSMSRDDFKQRRLIQTFNRFLLDRLALDECKLYGTEQPNRLNDICGVLTETNIFSNFCSLTHKRVAMYHSIDINTLPSLLTVPTTVTILNYMEASINKHAQQSITCENCAQIHPVNASLTINKLSHVVVLNIDLTNHQMNEIRYLTGWLVPNFYYALSPLGTPVLRTNTIGGTATDMKRYELIGYTAQITNRDNESHLVTYSKIRKNANDSGTWYLFNDFLSMEVTEEEVLQVAHWWKKPVVVVYKEVGIYDEFNPNIYMENLNKDILYRDQFVSGDRENKLIDYTLLSKDEEIKPGTLVALDAEFVELSPAEYEFNSDGSKTLVRPAKLSLARISVVRGEGKREGECFIDDYIATDEPVHDYKTAYSGITHGDLDPKVSNKSLVHLQVAYRRIWLLLNMGCVFIGHWLSSDFRMINIYIPPTQVRDTGKLFYLKKERRKLGLKFLAHHVLKKDVQMSNHNSIEDAVSSLLLYKEYLKLKESGQFDSVLSKIYLEGQFSNFKIPTEITLRKG